MHSFRQSLFTLVAILVEINILSVITEDVTQSLGKNYTDQIRNKYFRADLGILLGIGEFRQLFSADDQVLQQFFSIMLMYSAKRTIVFSGLCDRIQELNN